MYTTLTAAPQLLDDEVLPPGVLSEEQIQEIADRTGIGRWAVRTAVWNRRDRIEQQIARVKEVWEAIPGARVDVSPIYAKEDYPKLTLSAEQIQAGIPTLQLIEATPPNFGHIGFSPIVPMTGSQVRFVYDRMKAGIEAAGVNFLGGLLVINERSTVLVTGVPFNTTDQEQAERAFTAIRGLVEELGSEGYGEYRAHLDFMDLAQEQYSFGDHAYRRFAETLKDAVDPKGIIMPGRHGIWGTAARARRAARQEQ
jgi:4-cresol dehydrogenase (hydroxylating)